MIFYTASGEDGRLHIAGTQADAKAINKSFAQIDIPTDKTGLMAWAQALFDRLHTAETALQDGLAAETSPSGSEQPSSIAPLDLPKTSLPPLQNGLSHDSFEAAWEAFPLALKLHYAELAIHDARVTIRPTRPGSSIA